MTEIGEVGVRKSMTKKKAVQTAFFFFVPKSGGLFVGEVEERLCTLDTDSLELVGVETEQLSA